MRGQPAGGIDAFAEPHHPHLPVHVDQRRRAVRPASTSATSSRIEFVPQSIAATRMLSALTWIRPRATTIIASVRGPGKSSPQSTPKQ